MADITTSLKVLNTVTAASSTVNTDVYVDTNGNVQGLPNVIDNDFITQVSIAPKVTQVLQVATFKATTLTDNSVYSITVYGWNSTTGMLETIPLSIVSATGCTANSIATQFLNALGQIGGLAMTAAIDGSDRLALTAVSSLSTPADLFAIFPKPYTVDAKLTSYTVDGSNGTTVGVSGVGYGTQLMAKYPSASNVFTSAGSFADAANIVGANNYTQVNVHDTVNGKSVILINEAATNVNDLIGAYGTLTALKAGFRATFSTRTSTETAAITVTTGAIALAQTGGTFSAFDLRAGDYLLVGANYAAEAITRIKITTSDTAGIGTYTTAVSAAFFRAVNWRLVSR